MAHRRSALGNMPQENDGAGLVEPVQDPSAAGAGDEEYQARVQRPQPPGLQPLQPAVPGMGGMGGAVPGGPDGIEELMQLLQSMQGGYK